MVEVSKEDLVTWFQKMQSYKRIDIMCTLLNLCLPFELRFLGTCLEELGRRDAQDLRGVELRVNNPQEFVNELGAFQKGLPNDTKIRRKMALYLALMRACNRTGVIELFKTLDRWGEFDFTQFSDGDPLKELLLVYTMAANHPVFSFEQRLKCGEIYSKIISSKAHLNLQSPETTSPITSPLTSSNFSTQHQQQHQTTSPPPFPSATFQQPTPQIINPQTQQQIPNPILMAFPPNVTPLIPTADPATTIALNVESLPSHMGVPQTVMQIPPDFSSPPPLPWIRYQPPIYPMVQMDTQFPPQASSPHLSQPSSPTHSRTGSPTRIQQQQSNQVQQQQQQQTSSQAQQQIMSNPVTQSQALRNNRSLRNARPSTETTPPPLQSQQQQQQQQSSQGSGTIYMGNDIMVPTINKFEEINMEGAISQLHTLALRNGYNRQTNTIPRQNKQQQNWNAVHVAGGAGAPIANAMNYTMHMVDPSQLSQINMRKTATGVAQGSDSGGSSTGEGSPPPIQSEHNVGLHGNANQTQSSGSLRNKQPLNLSRLNGGKHGTGGPSSTSSSSSSSTMTSSNNNNNLEFNNAAASGSLVTSTSSGNLPLLIGGQMHNFPTYRTMSQQHPPPQQQQRQFPTQQNGGDIMYPLTTSFLPPPPPIPIVVSSGGSQRASPSSVQVIPTPYPTNKMVQSCFNCGSINHTGLNCSEASMEDVTRNAVYKLDYTVNTPQLVQFSTSTTAVVSAATAASPAVMMPSPSANSLIFTNLPSNNNELDPQITFIDLTQDTTSSSSSSSTSSIHGAK
ncbi:CLUMA_CG007203, isoform A [Clunio marinus]|uniref:CLUMA_CG007203, isoform A n=1 Tax=Clunio marinus TaxID=568069 RepID=A0A1J1I1P3_9DIPT|nr:CLUMA_CG007203, isoform A [Clunio marinus]